MGKVATLAEVPALMSTANKWDLDDPRHHPGNLSNVGGVMSAHDDLEAALAALIVEKTGEAWPVTAWVLIASTTDRETMLLEEPFWAFSQGQHSAMTRGLIEQARDELTADAIASIAYIPLDDDDDD